MSQIMKGFLGMFLILLIVVSGLSISASMLNAAAAKSFKTNMITELENSHFYYEVINECMNQGEAQGYHIQLKIFTEHVATGERTTKVITSPSVNIEDTEGAYMIEAVVEYRNRITIFGIDEMHQLRGYAR